ncbi:alpha/beta fold hydrolase [Aurantiacibacter spongiae]|uniref:Alpha/beta hydrolase n=1 Tax=Aurantiacibacter spongiae TaxID=2488860 RepID=A0A3N5DKN6_9SPHN|nr:alpha/beta hydrolase [Aurantiacibacter spongiae]RPF72272.1 alpha/beta hydrolase [Aurantiacibacter spongiae]
MTYATHRYRSSCGRLDLHARDYGGDGPPILLMHGLTRNSADFAPLATHLASDYRLIVPDQRGRGLSGFDPDPTNYRPPVYAADMFALLAELKIERAALIGTSMGGLIAMLMQAMKPETIGPVVLNDVGPVLEAEGLSRIAGYVGGSATMANWNEACEAVASINGYAFPDATDKDWMAFARRVCREREDGAIKFAYDPAIAEGFAEVEGEAQPDLWPLWEKMADTPVLVVRGALSDLFSTATLRQMEERHAGPFSSVEVPRVGHAPVLDEPEAVKAILTFLGEYWS